MKPIADPLRLAEIVVKKELAKTREPMRPYRLVQIKHGKRRFMMKMSQPEDEALP